MPKAPYKHPSVFVACPYTPKQRFDALRAALKRVPLEFHFADSAIRTRHVLERVRRGIVQTDFSLFDITDWNANVTLELGLAEGLNKDYYILFRPGRNTKTQPPSDVQGLQRFQYRDFDGFSDECLTYQLNQQLVKKLTHPRWIYDNLSGPKRDKAFVVTMRMLAYFKDHRWLNRKDLDDVAAGSYLRTNALKDLLHLLRSRRLITGRLEGRRWKAGRKLYKGVQF